MEKHSIYAKLGEVTHTLALTGITKDQRNQHGNYNFRGIDDVYNAVGPILAEAGVVIIPVVEKCKITPDLTSTGKKTKHAKVTVRYKAVSAADGSMIESVIVGEGQDNADKAVNKAMSAAYKLFIFQTFCVPTEGGSHDAEAAEPEPLVTETDLANIRAMLLTSNTDEAQFVEFLKVDSLESIPLSGVAHVTNMLNRKLERMSHEYEANEKAANAGSES